MIGLRHEIEHQMTSKIDDLLSARFQASCLNYNEYIKKLFDDNEGIEKYLSFSLQFSSINTEQKKLLEEHTELPANILSFISSFDAIRYTCKFPMLMNRFYSFKYLTT